MKLPARTIAWVLPLLLSGCFWRKAPKAAIPPTAPPVVDSSLPPPAQETPPEVSIPTKPQVTATKLPEQTAKPPSKHKKPPVPAEDIQQAAAPPEVSAIGQLSSGDPGDLRRETEASIISTERGLSGINRGLNDQEQKTAEHIREFLKQAKAALASGDVAGASTLTAKARVLLAELQH